MGCLFVPRDRPLLHHLPLRVGQAPGSVEVIAVYGVQAAVDLRRHGHGGAAGGRQP